MRLAIAACLLLACRRGPDDSHVPARAGLRVAACAAYPYEPAKTGAVVIDGAGNPGDLVEFHGHTFNIHRDDCAVIDHPIIHWSVDGERLFVGLGDDDAVGARSEHRISQYDAIYAGDEILSISLYEQVLRDVIWLVADDGAAQRKLYEKLTGAPPPTR